ncbi:glycosyltransferase [Sulfurospirillum sp. 1612]|uniref:glycosyltransferase n=1 Tax=Sulfurospirillum sp. 1612 TaxID=3094835 RepID=UPI002F922A21
MKKVAIIIDSLAGGGAEKVMLEIASGFLSQNAKVNFYIRKNHIEHLIPDNLNLFCLEDIKTQQKMRRKDYALLLKKVLIKDGPFDLILSNLESTDKMVRLLKFPNTYFVIHNTISQKLKKRYSNASLIHKIKYLREILKFKRLYHHQNLITVSHGVQKDLLTTLHIKPKFITTIYNPFDINGIIEKASEFNPLVPKEPYIVHIGRFLIEHKRQDLLLEAYQHANIKEKLVIIGKGQDKSKILNIIQKLHLENKVIMLDFQKNPYPFIKNAEAFVLSSDYEGLPTVLIEALILQTPIVSTDCPSGPREILEGSLNKYLSSCNDPIMLGEKIKMALSEKSNIKKTLASINLEKYQIDAITKQYLELGN